MKIPKIEKIHKYSIDFWTGFPCDVFDINWNIQYSWGSFIGLDPGTVHLGLAFLMSPNISRAIEIKTKRENSTEGRLKFIWKMLNSLGLIPDRIVIEGASYADRYRQVELQDIRAGAVSWTLRQNLSYDPEKIQIVPPLTIRKTVFGSAKIKNPWAEQGIPDNAAAALGCALYPIMKEKGK